MHNPYSTGDDIYIERHLSRNKAFDKIIGNKYFSEKLSSNTRVNVGSVTATPEKESEPKKTTLTTRITLAKDFNVDPPVVNYIWFYLKGHLDKSELLTGYYMLGYTTLSLIVLLTFYQI
jgi:hypothetical protein